MSFSSTVQTQTQRPKTMMDGLLFILHHMRDMSKSYISFSSTVQTLQPKTTTGGPRCIHASVVGNTEVIRILFEHGPGVTAQDNDGSAPLHCASQEGHVEAALASSTGHRAYFL